MDVELSSRGEVLVVDDDATTRARLEFLLRRNGFRVATAVDGESAWTQLKERHFSLVLTDRSMPGSDGLTLCRRIRAASFPDYTYIILLTGHSEKVEVAQGLEAGADDYVTKPFDSGELLARLRVGLRILSMQRRMQGQQRQLEELASLDGLTGVLNRRALESRLSDAHACAGRRHEALSVALLDLDHFKSVNDTYGHQAGDLVLKEVARRVRQVTRDYDSVGRYGGEEFLVVLNEAGEDAASRAAERIRKTVSETPVEFESVAIPITTSIGVACCPDVRGHDVRTIVGAADAGLYEAKRRGRNRVVVRLLLDETKDLVGTAVGHEEPGAESRDDPPAALRGA